MFDKIMAGNNANLELKLKSYVNACRISMGFPFINLLLAILHNKGLIQKTREASNIGQKRHFFLKKRSPKISPQLFKPVFFGILH